MLPNLAFHFSIGLNARHTVDLMMMNQKTVVFDCDKKVWRIVKMRFFTKIAVRLYHSKYARELLSQFCFSICQPISNFRWASCKNRVFLTSNSFSCSTDNFPTLQSTRETLKWRESHWILRDRLRHNSEKTTPVGHVFVRWRGWRDSAQQLPWCNIS